MAARDQFIDTILREITVTIDATDYDVTQALANVRVEVYKLNDDGSRPGAPSTIYGSRTGAATSNPFDTVAGGLVSFWADAGQYEIDFSDNEGTPRIADYTIGWASVPAMPGGILAKMLPESGAGLASPGDIVPTARATVPTGWLVCEGQVLSQATYAALFAAISTEFNTGSEGAGNFRLPDIEGRVIVGADPGGSVLGSLRDLGDVGGSQAITLGVTEIPAHAHGVTDPGHTHGLNGGSVEQPYVADTGKWLVGHGLNAAYDMPAGGVDSATTGITTTDTGGGQPHGNMQPYLVLRYIIKT